MASVRIWSAPNFRDVTAVIDTGSSLSTVRPDVADELMLPLVDPSQFVLLPPSMQRRELDVVYAELRFEQGSGTYKYDAALGVLPSVAELVLGMDFVDIGELAVNGKLGIWSLIVRRDETLPDRPDI